MKYLLHIMSTNEWISARHEILLEQVKQYPESDLLT